MAGKRVTKRPDAEILSEPALMRFDTAGTLLAPWPARDAEK